MVVVGATRGKPLSGPRNTELPPVTAMAGILHRYVFAMLTLLLSGQQNHQMTNQLLSVFVKRPCTKSISTKEDILIPDDQVY